MRRTPEAMPPSDSTLKAPISTVLPTCVPPHSSIDTPGMSNTRTCQKHDIALSSKDARLELQSCGGGGGMLLNQGVRGRSAEDRNVQQHYVLN